MQVLVGAAYVGLVGDHAYQPDPALVVAIGEVVGLQGGRWCFY
jgi:hypothetical protein